MSQEETESTEIQAQNISEIDGIKKKVKPEVSDLKEEIVTTDLTETIEKKLQQGIDSGINFSDKATYSKFYHEIAGEVDCSYANVARIAKKYLNKSKTVQEVVQSDKNKIKIQGVEATIRPERREPIKKQPTLPASGTTDEGENLELQFETAMLEMSFENVANFEKMFLGVSPQAKKMKKMALTIAIYNDRMSRSGHPEKRINVGDRLMQVMIWGGLIGMFLEPLGIKLRDRAESKSKDGIKKKESMR